MKVGIITNTYPPNLNGVSIAVESLRRELKNLGIQVFIVTPEIEGVRYPKYILPIKSSNLPKVISPDLKLPSFYLNSVYRFFKANKVQIIHTHDTFFGGPEGVILSIHLGIPAIHTFHTMIEEYDYIKFPRYKKVVASFIRDLCNQHNHIIAPSQKIYRYLLEKGVSSPISQILNVPSVHDLQKKPTPDKVQQIRKKMRIEQGDQVIITFCRLAKEKGLIKSLETVAPILKQNPKIKYLLAGWGPQAPELKSWVKLNKLESQVIFWGKYKRSELPILASISEFFLFTSITENLPTNIWEAMYLGLPVVAIDDDSVDYLLKSGLNGLKVSEVLLTSSCLELLQNKTKLQKMSLEAMKSAQTIEPRKIAMEHLTLYSRILELENQQRQILAVEDKKSKNPNFKIVKNGLKKIKQAYKKLLDNLEEK